QLIGYENLGSVSSGGRYDSLVSVGKKNYPRVGMSIGVSRLMAFILGEGSGVRATRGTPSAVVVAVTEESRRGEADAVATALRARDTPCEGSPSAAEFGRPHRQGARRDRPFSWCTGGAERRNLPFVWSTDGEAGHEVKDLRSGEQAPADPDTWTPDAEDLWPRVYRA